MADSNTIAAQTGIRSYEEYKQTRTVNQNLGKDEFLQLLAAQLQYQDPLEPMSDTDFIAQLAQFSSLQQLESLTNVMTTYQYFGLAGQYVYAEVTLDTGETGAVRGLVDRVIMQNGTAYAQVGDYLVDCSKITQVYDKDIFLGNTALLENTGLIGKYIKGYSSETDADGKSIEVEGKCMRITAENSVLVAYLESGEKISVGNIFDVSDSPFETIEDSGEL